MVTRASTVIRVGMGALVMTATSARAQAPLPLLDAEARLADFGMATASQVLRGRVSVAHTPGGAVLGVYFLRDHAQPASALLAASASESVAPHVPGAPDVPAATGVPAAPAVAREELPRPEGLWVWNTRELLADPGASSDFLAFVERHGFARVFLQIPPGDGERAEAGFVPFDGAAMGGLVASVTAMDIRVYALDGDPSYALRENHAGVYRTVARVAEHNRQAPPGQRFFGVRYDVEPYLARGFHGPRRQEILDGYVTLVAGLSERAHSAGMAVGVDIPFWLDGPDEETGAPLTAALEGDRRTVLEHVLGLVDDVAVMDYRTEAAGEDGSVAHARSELEEAAAAGTGVMVAVETEALVDEDLYTFAGTGWSGLPGDNGKWIVLVPEEGDGVRLWLVDGAAARAELTTALARAEIEEASLRYWPAGRAARVAAAKQSFHDLGSERLLRETARAAGALAAYPAFLGLAYHNYLSLKALLSERPR